MRNHARVSTPDDLTELNASQADPWLTVMQAAAIVQVHPTTVLREIRSGRMRHVRVAGRRTIRLRQSWLDAWLDLGSADQARSAAPPMGQPRLNAGER